MSIVLAGKIKYKVMVNSNIFGAVVCIPLDFYGFDPPFPSFAVV